MKKFNFLSKLWSSVAGSQRNDVEFDRRLTVGSPSGFTINWTLKLVSVLVLVLTIGIGNVWGADATISLDFEGSSGSWPYNSNWTCDASSNATNHTAGGSRSAGMSINGSQYITCSLELTNIKQVTLWVNRTTNNTASPTITIQKSTDGGKNWSDITGASQTFSITKNTWTQKTFDFASYKYNGRVRIKYTNSTTAVKLIDDIVVTYEEASCNKKVTITKGTPETGGSFSLDKTGEQNCCDALTVTVSSIVAPSGKKFSAITQSGIASGVTINQSAKTVTYAANTTGSSTINVTYEDKGCTDHGASSITGGALSDADHGPVHAYYDYSTSQFLYTKSDLDLAAGKKGTIKSIYFEYSGAAAMAARTIKIYMANTDLSSLTTSNYVPYASFTQVYSGTFSCGSAGWYEITLDTPFDYNGAGQLAVMIDDNTNTYESSKSFKYHSATGKQIYKRQDDTDIDPSSWTPASAIDYRPNTKFCIQEADMVQYTVNWYVNGSLAHSQTGYPGTTLTSIPTPDESDCDGSKLFVGWYTSTYSHATDAPDFVSPTTIPNGGANYYAVFATSASSSKTYAFDITPSDFNGDGYAYNTGGTTTATATDASGATIDVDWVSSNCMLGSSKIQVKKNTGYIYNSTDLGTVNSVSITKTNGTFSTWYGTSEHPTSGSQGSGKGYFTVKETGNSETGYISNIKINFTKIATSYSDYSTTCCTQLGQPATLKLDKTAYTITATWTATSGGHENGYSVQLYNSSSVAVGDPVAIDCSSDCDLEHEFTGLSANTTYYVGVTPTYSGAGDYCTSGTEKKVSVKTDQVYQVTYNGNNKTSGTVPTDANYYEAGTTVTVKTNSGTLVRSGHTFNGWNTANDGSGEHYAASGSATFTMPAENVTLYAEWVTKKDYYIDRMHGNWDGEHTVEVNGVVYNCYLREGAGYTRPTLTDNEGGSNTCVTGHSHFLGWVLDSKIGAQGQLLTGYTIYAGGSSGTSSTDGTVYWAVWAEDEE